MKVLSYSCLHWMTRGALSLGLVSSLAHAELGQNLSVDPRALSMGNAVTADPPGLSAIHYNPAALTKVRGIEADITLLVAQFDITREFNAPPGYNVFGYSDDPIVCSDASVESERLCSSFKTGRSKVEGPSLFIPIADKLYDFPKNVPIVAPRGGVAYRPAGSRLTYATGLYAPMVAGYHQADGDPGNFMGKQLAFERISYLTPTIAYQASDQLSLGASVGFSYQALGLNTDLRFPNEMVGVVRLVNDDICAPFRNNSNFVSDLLLLGLCNTNSGISPFKKLASMDLYTQQKLSPTYNLGLMWEPNNRFSFGIVYQSGAKTNMTGRYKIENGQAFIDTISALNSSTSGVIVSQILGFPSSVPKTETGHVSLNVEYPQHFQAGVKYMVTPKLKMSVDLGWTDYAAWNNWVIQFDRPIAALMVGKLLNTNITSNSLTLPFNFQSVWNWSLGAEYAVTDRLKVRAGYEPRPSAIPDDKRNTLLPINNSRLYGAGFSYKWNPTTIIDFSAAQLQSTDTIPANTSSLANQTGIGNLVLNPYAGLDVKTKTRVNILGLTYQKRW